MIPFPLPNLSPPPMDAAHPLCMCCTGERIGLDSRDVKLRRLIGNLSTAMDFYIFLTDGFIMLVRLMFYSYSDVSIFVLLATLNFLTEEKQSK